MLPADQIAATLEGFTGTENYYEHQLGLHYTDGVHYLAESAGCFWLLGAIASYQSRLRSYSLQCFQLWTLTVDLEKKTAVLVCKDDEPGKTYVRQEIGYTDFPLPNIMLYVEHGVILLPGEH